MRKVHVLVLALILLWGCGEQAAELSEVRAARPELAPYVEFLRAGVEDPAEYVVGLFDDHDMVVLCERWHPEMTQYELFYEVASDARLAGERLHVFSELGGRNLQQGLDTLMAAPGLDQAEFERRLLPIYRDLGLHPGWDTLNFFQFVRRLYVLNQSRVPEERVRLHFSDISLDWQTITAEGYAELMEEVVPQRDRLLAELIVDRFGELERAGESAKALVIMNYRHAFNDFSFADGSKGDNVGRYLFEAFPGRVANVMLNALALLPGTTDRNVVAEPIQKGRWDAAFRFAGVEEAGFDFAGSPFGADSFDYFTFRPHTVSYADVFTGFVFYRPLSEHVLVSGISGMYDGFDEEYRRRVELTGRELSEEDLREAIASSEAPVHEGYDEPEKIEEMIAAWLRDPSVETTPD